MTGIVLKTALCTKQNRTYHNLNYKAYPGSVDSSPSILHFRHFLNNILNLKVNLANQSCDTFKFRINFRMRQRIFLRKVGEYGAGLS